MAFLADVHRVQRDVRPDAHPRSAGHAPARRRIRRAVRRLEPVHLVRCWILGLSTLIFLYNMVVSWRGGPRAVANPWRGLTLEWQVSSPPPVFNFDAVPTVVGGPYEYGVPGAVHGIFKPPRRPGPSRPGRLSTPPSQETHT